MFFEYVENHIRSRRDNWDNISDDWKFSKPLDTDDEMWSNLSPEQQEAAESFEACERTCSAIEECKQFKYREGECICGRDIRIGRSAKSEMSSGWLLDKIQAHGETYKECEPNWEFNQ
jgi:hypothetical protein